MLACKSPRVCSGTPYVGGDKLEQVFVGDAFPDQLADRKPEPFFVNLAGGGGEPEAADVRQVGNTGTVADQARAAEDGPHDRDVVDVPGAHPRIVGADRVAGAQGFGRELGQHVAHRRRPGADERGGAVIPLGDRPGAGVEQHDRQIQALADVGGERGTHQGAHHLVGDGDQTIPDNAQAHRVQVLHATLTTML